MTSSIATKAIFIDLQAYGQKFVQNKTELAITCEKLNIVQIWH